MTYLNIETKYVKGPDGTPLTLNDLPPVGKTRWVIRRKAEVVAEVSGGLLTLKEACQRYGLTIEEFLSWEASVNNYGSSGLKVTQIRMYRR